MMRRKIISTIVVFTIIIFSVSSCKKPVSELARYVPKDAATVFTVDLKSVTDKLTSSGMSMDSLANLFTDKKDEYSLHWDDLKNSGIDLTASLYVFMKNNNSMQSGNVSNICVIAKVDDAKKTEAFFKKENPGADVMQDSKYKYMALGDDYVAGWTDKVLIISRVSGGNYAPGVYKNGQGTLSQQQITTLLNQDESGSIASNGDFRDLVAKQGDMHFWSNAEASANSLGALSMTKIPSLFQGTYTEGTIDFEKGKAVFSATSHYNKTLSDILKKYPSREVDKTMLNKYTGNINGFGIVAFNPKVLLDILNYLGFNTMSDQYLSQMGISTNDIINAFKGDIAVIFSDFSMQQNQHNENGIDMQNRKRDGNFLVNIAIGDKASFDKVMNALVQKNILSRNGNSYSFNMFKAGNNLAIETSNNSLLIASSGDIIKSYGSGSNKSTLPDDVEKQLNNKSAVMYVDISSLMQISSSSDTDNIKMMNAAKSTFKNFIATTDKSDNQSISGQMQLNTVNNNENSLASIVKFMAAAHTAHLNRKKYEIGPPENDDNGNDESDSTGENK